jgi:GNAT superfamily N-acetyltransferase
VWCFLSTEAYWGKSRTRAGFARAVSDGVAFAYLADVFVVRAARGAGLGQALVETMIERGPGAHFRWTLHTADAHGLYRKFGFAEPNETLLERPYRVQSPPGAQ